MKVRAMLVFLLIALLIMDTFGKKKSKAKGKKKSKKPKPGGFGGAMGLGPEAIEAIQTIKEGERKEERKRKERIKIIKLEAKEREDKFKLEAEAAKALYEKENTTNKKTASDHPQQELNKAEPENQQYCRKTPDGEEVCDVPK